MARKSKGINARAWFYGQSFVSGGLNPTPVIKLGPSGCTENEYEENMVKFDRTTDKDPTPRCFQCGNTEPANGFITKTVYHLARNSQGKRFMAETSHTVCKGTDCGLHLTFSYEG